MTTSMISSTMADEEKLYKPRKSHKKSRNGCKNCRRRKIKVNHASGSSLSPS